MNNKKKTILISVIAGVLLVGGAGAAIGIISTNQLQSSQSILAAGEKYLLDQKYEQAIIEFQRVIEIDPMNTEAYIGLADAYLGLGDTEKALEVLREGFEATGDSRVQDKIDALTKPLEISSSMSFSSEPVESEPVFGTMGSVTVAGTVLDISTTESLFIINKELYEAGIKWKYGDLESYEGSFDSVIYLNDNLSNDDLNEISRLSYLKKLEIDYAGISDISFLERLTNLTILQLRSNQISDITPLSGLTNLSNLDLADNQISDITPLARLTNLIGLDLFSNQISDVTLLSGFNHLKYLDLDFNRISDIAPLSGLTNLTSLDLGGNQIRNIMSLSGLTNLTDLGLWNNQISDEEKAWLKELLPNCEVRT